MTHIYKFHYWFQIIINITNNAFITNNSKFLLSYFLFLVIYKTYVNNGTVIVIIGAVKKSKKADISKEFVDNIVINKDASLGKEIATYLTKNVKNFK